MVPEPAAIADGSYSPLSRPLFIYVNTEALRRPEVQAFVQFYMEQGAELARDVGYVPEDAGVYSANARSARASA